MEITEVKRTVARFDRPSKWQSDWLIAEYDRLTNELTTAKEEIERLKYWEQFVCERCHGVGEITVMSGQTPESYSQDNLPCPDCVGPIIDRAEAAEAALTAERKETERLREGMTKAVNRLLTEQMDEQDQVSVGRDLLDVLKGV
jgi:hypothetical protein